MENILDIINLLSKPPKTNEPQQTISKELIDEYPYGQFPIKYTKSGQEKIRANSESRFKDDYNISNQSIIPNNDTEQDLSSMLPIIISILTTKDKKNNNILDLIEKLLENSNPDICKIIKLLKPKSKNQPITTLNKKNDAFPDTNVIDENSLTRI